MKIAKCLRDFPLNHDYLEAGAEGNETSFEGEYSFNSARGFDYILSSSAAKIGNQHFFEIIKKYHYTPKAGENFWAVGSDFSAIITTCTESDPRVCHRNCFETLQKCLDFIEKIKLVFRGEE